MEECFYQRSYVYRVVEQGNDAVLGEALFLHTEFNYTRALENIRASLRKHGERNNRILRMVRASEQKVKRNLSTTVVVPEGGLMALLSLQEYVEFINPSMKYVAEFPMHVERGIPSISLNTTKLGDGQTFVIVVANIPTTWDTVLVCHFEIVEAIRSMMTHPVQSSVFSNAVEYMGTRGEASRVDCSSQGNRWLVSPGLSLDPAIRFELFAREHLDAGVALCGEVLIPFGHKPDTDQAWLSSPSYYRLVHNEVQYRPALFSPSTGEVHSCLWMANDALIPFSEYPHNVEVNCQIRQFEDIMDFVDLFPFPDHTDLDNFPELQGVLRCATLEGRHMLRAMTPNWIYYVLTSTRSINKGSPLRFSYGLYSAKDNMDTMYRSRGIREGSDSMYMFFDTDRPLPKICRIYPLTNLTMPESEPESAPESASESSLGTSGMHTPLSPDSLST